MTKNALKLDEKIKDPAARVELEDVSEILNGINERIDELNVAIEETNEIIVNKKEAQKTDKDAKKSLTENINPAYRY